MIFNLINYLHIVPHSHHDPVAVEEIPEDNYSDEKPDGRVVRLLE